MYTWKKWQNMDLVAFVQSLKYVTVLKPYYSSFDENKLTFSQAYDSCS